jgi:hypothetical protein
LRINVSDFLFAKDFSFFDLKAQEVQAIDLFFIQLTGFP